MIREYNKKKQWVRLKRLEKRVANAKKVLYSNPHKTLYEVLQIIKQKENTHYEQS